MWSRALPGARPEESGTQTICRIRLRPIDDTMIPQLRRRYAYSPLFRSGLALLLRLPRFLPEMDPPAERECRHARPCSASIRPTRRACDTAFELPASEEWLDRKQNLDQAWRTRLEKLRRRVRWMRRERAEYLLLRSEVQGDLDDMALARKRLAEIARARAFPRHDPTSLKRARRNWNTPNWRTTASKMAELGRAAKQAREHLPKSGRQAVTTALALHAAGERPRSARYVQAMVCLLRRLSARLRLVGEEALRRRRQAIGRLRQAASRGDCRPKEQRRRPAGWRTDRARRRVAAEIRRQWLPYTADELIAIGEREFAWCENGNEEGLPRDEASATTGRPPWPA